MDCHVEWSTSNVEHGKLRVSLEQAPDFAFMMEFDRIVDPLTHPQHKDGAGFSWPTATLSSAACASSLLNSCVRFSIKQSGRLIGSPWTLAPASNSGRKPKRLASPNSRLSSRPPQRPRPSATRN
jgi:hypothetical protein